MRVKETDSKKTTLIFELSSFEKPQLRQLRMPTTGFVSWCYHAAIPVTVVEHIWVKADFLTNSE